MRRRARIFQPGENDRRVSAFKRGKARDCLSLQADFRASGYRYGADDRRASICPMAVEIVPSVIWIAQAVMRGRRIGLDYDSANPSEDERRLHNMRCRDGDGSALHL